MTDKFNTIATIRQLFNLLPAHARKIFLIGVTKNHVPPNERDQTRLLMRLAYDERNTDEMLSRLRKLVKDYCGHPEGVE